MKPQIATITLNPAIDQTAAIVDFKAGEVNRVDWEQVDPGGKGVNVASFLTDFGYSVTVSGFLGQDNAGLFESFFAQKGIHNRFVLIPGKTRVNVKIIDAAQNQVTDINFPGQVPTATDTAALIQVVDQLAMTCDWFVLSGSIPVGLSPRIYAELITRLQAQGKTVVLDASGESFRQALPLAPYAIKPNLAELQELVGQPLETEVAVVQAAQALLAQGLHCVVVSMGARGAIFAEADAVVYARPPQIQVVSTVGAGDAMVAGLVIAKLRGLSLAESARLATAFSLGALSQVGPRLPPRETIESLSTQVTIQDLKSLTASASSKE